MDLRVDHELIRELRSQACLTQEELAEASGLRARTVQRIEATGTASELSVRAIASALSVASSELVVGSLQASDIAGVMQGAGAAFLWVALSVLVWVPTTDQEQLVPIVAVAGFASFVIGIWLTFRSLERRLGRMARTGDWPR